ncbi:alpha/beta hydrolase [Neobacillus niacini]|uniref:alpha/beta fold hydrolase n=1 Tax=Neobacillus niacini TaxID=86668 RepID=UPI002FFDCEEB
MKAYDTKKVNTGKYKTFFCEAGKGNNETIILIHGSGPGANSETNWKNVIPELSENFHVVALDYYGYGKSDYPETPPTSLWEWTSLRIEQILELMDYLNVEKVNLVGNSLGGYISLNMVMTAPERVEKVVLMGSPGGEAGPTPEIVRMSGFFRNPTYNALKNITSWFVHDPKIFGDQLDEIVQERYEAVMKPEFIKSFNSSGPGTPFDILIPPNALKQMELPILMIHGVEDRFVQKESSLSMLEHLPNAQLHLIKGCGHWVQIEKRELFIHLVSQFFKGKMM